ncbi:MAG: hypothetical protein ACRDIE_24925 [Chloroflexota bacterium]
MRSSTRRVGVIGVLLMVTATQPRATRALAATPPIIGVAPKACAGSTHFVSLPNLFGDGKAYGDFIGGDPVWIRGFVGPHATLHARYYELGHGWEAGMMFALKRGFSHTATLRGGSMHGHAPLWFDAVENGAPNGETRTLTLAAKRQKAFPGGAGPGQWPTFPGGIVVPRAGCYYVEATWPGGAWRITFAAGR